VAAAQPFRAPTGTHDVLPPESARWEALVACFAGQVERAGYGLIQSPLFEDIGVFQRMGEGTDVVRKEMYDFHDKGDRHVALRPEGTASVVRAFVEHRPSPPWKTWYVTPSFRYERPQAGRYRQHHQLGVEAMGVEDPDLDVEVISLLWSFFDQIGLRQLRLHLNSMGDLASRSSYLDQLRAFLFDNESALADDDRAKIADHPMRVLDSKRPETRAAVAGAPTLVDSLDPASRARFDRVEDGLRAVGIPYEIDPRLVRGLDYYTHTLFEFQSSALGTAQSTILGGGRYDGLIEQLGGPSTPGIGFGCGIERVLLTCDAEGVFGAPESRVDCFVVDTTGGEAATAIAHQLRLAGLHTERAFDARSMKAQMKLAGRSAARFALIVGEQEVADGTITVRDLGSSEQTTIGRDVVIDHLRKVLDQ
jgi:histidyl-tRNA synthetase